MTATAVVTTIGEPEDSELYGPRQGVKVACSDCSHAVYTGGPIGYDWAHILDHHLIQHQPGRAVDIEVSWDPSADCPVCEDGIGDIRQEDDGLQCRECGTTWDLSGEHGWRAESEAVE